MTLRLDDYHDVVLSLRGDSKVRMQCDYLACSSCSSGLLVPGDKAVNESSECHQSHQVWSP